MFPEPTFDNKGNFLAVKGGEEKWFETYAEARTWYYERNRKRN